MSAFDVAFDRNDFTKYSEIRRLVNDLKGTQKVSKRRIPAADRVREHRLVQQRWVAADAKRSGRVQRVKEVLDVLFIVRLTLFEGTHTVF